jgi:hypothetical protein
MQSCCTNCFAAIDWSFELPVAVGELRPSGPEMCCPLMGDSAGCDCTTPMTVRTPKSRSMLFKRICTTGGVCFRDSRLRLPDGRGVERRRTNNATAPHRLRSVASAQGEQLDAGKLVQNRRSQPAVPAGAYSPSTE